MASAEDLKEPSKIWASYTHENGAQVLDLHLLDPVTSEPLATIYGLEPKDVLRGVIAHSIQTNMNLGTYVNILASDAAILPAVSESAPPIH